MWQLKLMLMCIKNKNLPTKLIKLNLNDTERLLPHTYLDIFEILI